SQVDARSQERYYHAMRRITSAAGVEGASEVRATFDPTYQSLRLHFVRVRRGGTALDRLDAAKVKVIQREAELERHLYDGRLTALVVLEDVRVGDEIEYAFT